MGHHPAPRCPRVARDQRPRTQRPKTVETFRRWRDETPAEFRFALKAHCYLTHNRKLNDPLRPIRVERERARGLGEKPAACRSDAADWPPWDAVTTDLVYVRLHGHELAYASGYSEAQLRAWARKIRRWTDEGRDVHVYFDNDAYGEAPRNAERLTALLGARP